MKEYAKRPSRNLKTIRTPGSCLVVGTKRHGSKLIYLIYCTHLILQDLSISTLQLPVCSLLNGDCIHILDFIFLAQSLTTGTWITYCSLLKTL